MNWDAIGALGELVSALAVLATLIYLASQVNSMKAAVKSENLSRVQEDENYLYSQMLDNAELMVKANAGKRLDEIEEFKLYQMFRAHASQSFHHYVRLMTLEGNLKVPARVFADTLKEHPAFNEIWKNEEPSKDRFVKQWQEHVQDFVQRDA